MLRTKIYALLIVLFFSSALMAQPATPDRARLLEFFETKVRPVLAEQCFSCHGNLAKPKGGIRLDRKEFVFQASEEPLVVPGHPEKSLLIKAIRHEGEHKMPPPPKTKLSASVIEDITTWVKLGAVWPDEKPIGKAVDPRA